jgi:hypothetical protein
VGQGRIGQGGDEFVQLGQRQTRSHCVEALWFRSNVVNLRGWWELGLLPRLILPGKTRLRVGRW